MDCVLLFMLVAKWQYDRQKILYTCLSTVICIKSVSILFPICRDHNLFPVSKRYPGPWHLHCIISSTTIKTGNIDFVSVGSWNYMSRLVWHLPWLSSDWAFLARLHQIVYPLLWAAALPEWLSLWPLCKSYWLFGIALLLSGSLIVSLYSKNITVFNEPL